MKNIQTSVGKNLPTQIESWLTERLVYLSVVGVWIYIALSDLFYRELGTQFGAIFLTATVLSIFAIRFKKKIIFLGLVSLGFAFVGLHSWNLANSNREWVLDPVLHLSIALLALGSRKTMKDWWALCLWLSCWALSLGVTWFVEFYFVSADTRAPASVLDGSSVFAWSKAWGPISYHAMGLGIVVHFVNYLKQKMESLVVSLKAGRQERYYTLGLMSASLGHELSTPLTSLKGFLDILKTSIKDKDLQDAETLIERMEFNILRMIDITRSLKGFVQSEATIQQVRARDLISDTVVLLEHHLKSQKIDFKVEYRDPIEDKMWNVNRVEVGQILFNLVSNAKDAIKNSNVKIIKIVLSRATNDINAFVIEVVDSGPGVVEGFRETLFDSSFSTKPHGEGTGLGLWLSRELAKRNGLSLECVDNSRDLGGAVFRLSVLG